METDLTITHTFDGTSVELAVKTGAPSGNNSGPDQPGFVWLGGFRSDMTGTKAQVMVDHAAQMGCPSLRFDYSGHGQSGGVFVDGTISRWVDESLSVITSQTNGPQILVGSSLGGWVALRVALELRAIGQQARLGGLLLIAPAPDFTSQLMEPKFSDDQKRAMTEVGYIEELSQYSDEPNIITRRLIEDGRNNSVLDKDLHFGCPIHILQGKNDPDVPWQHAQLLMESLPHDDVVMSYIDDGDHRLSRDVDLELLRNTMNSMLERHKNT